MWMWGPVRKSKIRMARESAASTRGWVRVATGRDHTARELWGGITGGSCWCLM
jgi:hypothetical protein